MTILREALRMNAKDWPRNWFLVHGLVRMSEGRPVLILRYVHTDYTNRRYHFVGWQSRQLD